MSFLLFFRTLSDLRSSGCCLWFARTETYLVIGIGNRCPDLMLWFTDVLKAACYSVSDSNCVPFTSEGVAVTCCEGSDQGERPCLLHTDPFGATDHTGTSASLVRSGYDVYRLLWHGVAMPRGNVQTPSAGCVNLLEDGGRIVKLLNFPSMHFVTSSLLRESHS
jgi:hypothetical protein